MVKDSKRTKDLASVDCPEQMIAYCETFYLIDKGDVIESGYIKSQGDSKTHGWTPQL